MGIYFRCSGMQTVFVAHINSVCLRGQWNGKALTSEKNESCSFNPLFKQHLFRYMTYNNNNKHEKRYTHNKVTFKQTKSMRLPLLVVEVNLNRLWKEGVIFLAELWPDFLWISCYLNNHNNPFDTISLRHSIFVIKTYLYSKRRPVPGQCDHFTSFITYISLTFNFQYKGSAG